MNANRTRTRTFGENIEHEHTVFEKMLNTNMGFSKKSNANTCFVEIIEHGEHEHPFIFIPDWCATLTIFLRKNLEIIEPP